jgi:chromosomal replication initiator protein
MGLLADIQPPDYETRIAILKQKLERLRLVLSDSLTKYIATNVTANIRQLEGIANHINADHDLEGGEITLDMVRRAIKDILIGTGTKPTASLIIEEVCKYYNITPDRMKIKNQSKDVVLPRQIASYILQQLTDLSLADIGRELGGQHHTTIINSIKKIKNEMRDNPELNNIIKDLISNLSEPESSTRL